MKRAALIAAGLLCICPTALAAGSEDPALDSTEYSYSPTPEAEPAAMQLPPTQTEARRDGSVFVVRGGVFRGTGNVERTCDGDLCDSSSTEADYSETPGYVIGFDWLNNSSRNFRIGLGTALMPNLEVENDAGPFELGTAFSTSLLLEGVFDLSDKVAITVRGDIGLALLFPSGDLADSASQNEDACSQLELDTYETCETDTGPYFGASAGVGPGILYNMGKVGLRVDLQLQAYLFRTQETQISDTEIAVTFAGTRSMLMAGLEF